METARVYLETVKDTGIEGAVGSCDAPLKLSLRKTVQSLVVSYLSAPHMYTLVVQISWYISKRMWSEVPRTVNNVQINAMLGQSNGSTRNVVLKSAAMYSMQRMGFLSVGLGKGPKIGSYSWLLLHQNLLELQQDDRIFYERALSVSLMDLQACNVHIR